MKALTLARQCPRKKKFLLKLRHFHFYIPTRSRRVIGGKNQQRQFFNTNFATKSSLPIEAKIGRGVAEDPRRKSILLSMPSSPPIKGYCQNTIFIHKTSYYEKCVFFLRFPAQFCEFRSKNCSSYLNRMCQQTENTPFCFCFFPDKFWTILYIFGSWNRSYPSNKCKK